MKKLLAMLLALGMMMSLAACGEQKDNTDAPDDADTPTEITYAVEAGSAGEEVALANGFKTVPVGSQANALMEVDAGTADAAIIDLLMAGAMVGENTSYPDLKVTDQKLNSELYGVGCRKGSELASFIISQYGGPDGELGASLRYLSQRYTMPYPELKALLTDIGVEELGHLEMVGTIVHQLTRNMTEQEVKDAGYEAYFVDHTAGVYPTAASGFPWNAASMAVKGDLIADLTEDLAAEQKARVTYDNILRLSDDPDVNDVIKFLRAREIVHFQRFGEGLRLAKEKMDQKNLYFVNPSFDQ